MNKHEEIGDLHKLIKIELSRDPFTVDVDAYDKKFREDLVRWLTESTSTVDRFINYGSTFVGVHDLARARIIAETTEEYCTHRVIKTRLDTLLSNIETIEVKLGLRVLSGS